MSEPLFAVNFTARVIGTSASVAKGDALVFDKALTLNGVTGLWTKATSAARAAADSRTGAIALTAYGGSTIGKVSYQSSGSLASDVSGLGATTPGLYQLVRVSTVGRLERISSYTNGDDVVGFADPNGQVYLCLGLPWQFIQSLVTGFTAGGDLTGNATSQTVAKIQGVVISGTCGLNKALLGTGALAASWQTIPAGLTIAGSTGAAQLNSGSSTLAATTTDSFIEGSTTVGQKVAGNYIFQTTATQATWKNTGSDNTSGTKFATRSLKTEVTTTDNTVQTLYSWTIVDECVTVATAEVQLVQAGTALTGSSIKRVKYRRDGGTVTMGTVRDVDTDLDAGLVAAGSSVTPTLDFSGTSGRIRGQGVSIGNTYFGILLTRYEVLG